MWAFLQQTHSWTRVPHGGGGVVPPSRAEAALAVVPGVAGGGAMLFGGYSDLQARCFSHNGIQQLVNAYRYFNDAYVHTEAEGWRALLCEGSPPPPAGAQRCAAFDAARGRVLLLGGYHGQEKFSFAHVHVLRVDGFGHVVPVATTQLQCLACGLHHADEELVARGGKLRRCSRCRRASYCSAAYQHAHWQAHKAECKQACEE
jgi:hypothetical protein